MRHTWEPDAPQPSCPLPVFFKDVSVSKHRESVRLKEAKEMGQLKALPGPGRGPGGKEGCKSSFETVNRAWRWPGGHGLRSRFCFLILAVVVHERECL